MKKNEKEESASTRKKKKKKKVEAEIQIFHKWCKGCGICIAFCPKGVLETRFDGHPVIAHPERCIHCGLCDLRCPDFAITGKWENPKKKFETKESDGGDKDEH